MTMKNTINTYGSVSKFFHWTIFILVLGMLSFGFFLDDVPKPYQGMTYNIHKLTGLTILTLMAFRLFWRSINAKPGLPYDTPYWQIIAERTVHFLLYLSLFVMPLAGWVGSAASGHPPHLGDWVLNLPINHPNKPLAEAAFTVHNWTAYILIGLITIHVLAALYHFFIKKDDILSRMLPHRRHAA